MGNNIVTTIRMDESLMEMVKIYSEIEDKSQTDFINDLLKAAFDNYFNLRSGDGLLKLPNPQRFDIDEEKAEAALEILHNAFKALRKLHINYAVPEHGILAFFEQRLFYELPEDREQFEKNMILDCTQGETFAEIKNV